MHQTTQQWQQISQRNINEKVNIFCIMIWIWRSLKISNEMKLVRSFSLSRSHLFTFWTMTTSNGLIVFAVVNVTGVWLHINLSCYSVRKIPLSLDQQAWSPLEIPPDEQQQKAPKKMNLFSILIWILYVWIWFGLHWTGFTFILLVIWTESFGIRWNCAAQLLAGEPLVTASRFWTDTHSIQIFKNLTFTGQVNGDRKKSS